MVRLHVNGSTLLRAVAAATANLERHVDEVDALNVFPVPDGDTGSNMLATMRAALAEAEQLPPSRRDLDSVAEALNRGALTGARGNSGVILSQIIRGMTEQADGRRRVNGVDLALGLRMGSDIAYGSVLMPVEGTMLTVIRDAADAAESAAGHQPHVEAVLSHVIEAAATSVQRTPTLLPVLEEAGVVDSGGQGLFRVLEGMLQVGLPDRVARSAERVAGPALRSQLDGDPLAQSRPPHLVSGEPHGYETQYLLASAEGGIDVAALQAALMTIGDSVVVAGDERRARVHVHGLRPDLALAAGLSYGRLSDVEVRDLDDQIAHREVSVPSAGSVAVDAAKSGAPIAAVAAQGSVADTAPAPSVASAVVAVASAAGLADILSSLGVQVVRPSEGLRPSVGEITAAIAGCGATSVFLLPNDSDALLAAEAAAIQSPAANVRVISTRNAAEGVAAALAFDPALPLAENATRMESEAAALRTFTVVTAARDAVVDGQSVRGGHVIALDAARSLLAIGFDVAAVTVEVLSTMEQIDLVTLYLGASESTQHAEMLRRQLEAADLDVEVEVVRGGQAHDHLLVAVE